MPNGSRTRCRRLGSRSRHRLRGAPGRRRYGCHPNAIGTARRPVGTIVVSTRSRDSEAMAVTSMRCGNGNAGASTAIDARDARGVAPGPELGRRTNRDGRRGTRGSGARCRRRGAGARRGRRSRRRRGRSRPESRLAHGASNGRPVVCPRATPSSPPGSARYSPPRCRIETPVMPSVGGERRRERTRGELHRGFAAEPPFLRPNSGGHGAGLQPGAAVHDAAVGEDRRGGDVARTVARQERDRRCPSRRARPCGRAGSRRRGSSSSRDRSWSTC